MAVTRTLSMVEARNALTSLPEQFAHERAVEAVVITRRGEPVLAVMPWELYDSLIETMHILQDPELMHDLRKSLQEMAAGDTQNWDGFKASLRF